MEMTTFVQEPIFVQGPFVPEPADLKAEHAALAMQAAKKVRRARRQSQKEKMGHEVCHHLLCMLNSEEEPTPREKRLAKAGSLEAMTVARQMKKVDDRQMSMSF